MKRLPPPTPKAPRQPVNAERVPGVSDMTLLSQISHQAMQHNLHARFTADTIYVPLNENILLIAFRRIWATFWWPLIHFE